MFSHVLIAYDGSPSAERALEAGARLAAGVGAQVTLFHSRLQGPVPETLHAHGGGSPEPGDPHSVGGFYEAASMHESDLDAVGSRLLEQGRGVLEGHGIRHVETVQTAGDAAGQILEYARAHDVDTLVVGTRGHGRLAEVALGSVAHKLQHAFEGCVLTVH